MKLLFLLLGLFGKAHSHEKIRYVYLTYQNDPTSTITINIHGIKTAPDLIVYYDSVPCSGDIKKYRQGLYCKGTTVEGIPSNRKIYHAELTQLKPNCLYYFTIGDRLGSFTEEMAFKTLPEEGPLLLIEGGDWENTPSAKLLAQKAASLSPHALLLGGDYPSFATKKCDYQQWDLWLDTYTKTMKTKEGCLIPLILAIGNHEIDGGFSQTKDKIPFLLTYFKQNENTYFSLPLGKDRHLFVLDSGHAAPHNGQQKLWLENELKKQASKKFKIALYHVPLYPSIRFYEKNLFYYTIYGLLKIFKESHAAEKLFSFESSEGRKHWLSLFDAYRMTVAFEHHDQTLKRTKLLKEGKEDPRGTLYLGDGCFGPDQQHLALQKYFHNYFEKIESKHHFFWVILVENQKVSYAAVTADGHIIDRFNQKL